MSVLAVVGLSVLALVVAFVVFSFGYLVGAITADRANQLGYRPDPRARDAPLWTLDYYPPENEGEGDHG